MKLVIAIVNDDDANVVENAYNKAGISVTKLATTGGYLKVGNTTFLIGVEDEKVDLALEILKNNARKRSQIIQNSPEYGINTMAMPLEITVGGATVFVLNVDQFVKM